MNPKRLFTYLVRSTQYSQNIVLYNDLEKLLTSFLLMPPLWNITSNEPPLNKTFESKEIFYLSSTQYSVLTKHCTLQWPWRTSNFFIINATPMRQHLKRTIYKGFKQNAWIRRFFTYLASYVHCNLKSCMATVIIKRL